jgi:hypothetical protein
MKQCDRNATSRPAGLLRGRRGLISGVVGLILVGSTAGIGLPALAGAAINLPALPSVQTLVNKVTAVATTTTTTTAPAVPAPLPPTLVTAVQDGVSQDMTVNWTPSTLGTPATGALVQLYSVANASLSGGKYLGDIICQANCTTATFRQLTFGYFYAFAVWAVNGSTSSSSAVASNAVDMTTTCTVGACVTFNATSPIGAANHAASGILGSAFPDTSDQADMTALDTTMYRGAPVYTSPTTLQWNSWNVGVAAGAQTTLVLSDMWQSYNSALGALSTPTPWSNWGAYSSWVTSAVNLVLASGQPVTYWEPDNEPGGTNAGYSSSDQATVTVPLLLQQFLVTYQAIKAADPSAAIVGPATDVFSDYPTQYQAPNLDMVTFLNFAVANKLQLAGIVWHEEVDNLGPNPATNTLLPAILEDHVTEARKLLAARPSLGNPAIIIDEYGMPEVQLIPGWDVAYLAALTSAGVTSATRSCWSGACGTPSLDGLLASDGTTPWNSYWERTIYAAMSGNMITTTSTSDTVTALGSYNASTQTVTGLVGRGVGCTQDSWCASSWPSATLAPATNVTVTVTVPWSSGTSVVSLTDVPGQSLGPTAQPTPVQSDQTVTPTGLGTGTITITIPSFADGDAYGFTITPAT